MTEQLSLQERIYEELRRGKLAPREADQAARAIANMTGDQWSAFKADVDAARKMPFAITETPAV